MNTQNFKLICMSFDGAFVTDSEHETIEQAGNASADMGSRWYFYPYHFIVAGKTVKQTGEGLINMATKKAYMSVVFKGKRLQTVVKTFKKANAFCVTNDLQLDGYEFENLLINQNIK